MKQALLRFCCISALTAGTIATANATDIDGYFRVQNAAGLNNESGYVQVRGPFTAQPDQTFLQATTEAGTVMYIKATPQMINGKELYRIESLRCQGIEVVGQPISDYISYMQDLLTSTDIQDMNSALWTLVRAGFDNGYTSIGRALLQSMIWVVASRLDGEGVSAADELANFADRFNKEVADKIDLSIYLEPVGDKFRLLYDVPDLQCVSQWYLKDENKATFEKGFESMRRYLTAKIGNTGEYLQPDEVAEMIAWGYDPTVNHHNYVDTADGKFIYVPYEEIFADHDLLFNWLKLNMIKFTDESRCPKIELLGFYLPNFAKEMKNHALTAQLISYFPRLRTNERVYLTDGKNGVTGHLDFTSAEGADALGDAAQWAIRPVTEQDDAYLCFPYEAEFDGKYYTAVFVDFEMQAVNPETTKLYTLVAETQTTTINDTPYTYYEVSEVETAPARTAVLIEMAGADESEHRLVPVYDSTMPEPTPELPDNFGIGDDVVDKQHSAAMRQTSTMPYFHGVLLPTTVSSDSFMNQWNTEYDHTTNPVHTLTSRSGDVKALWLEQADEGTSIRANQAYLVNEPTQNNGYAIFEPIADKVTGVTDITGESAQQPDEIYDLNGRKVDNVVRGNMYIRNGKKIIIL